MLAAHECVIVSCLRGRRRSGRRGERFGIIKWPSHCVLSTGPDRDTVTQCHCLGDRVQVLTWWGGVPGVPGARIVLSVLRHLVARGKHRRARSPR
jgi:hypothetical protein